MNNDNKQPVNHKPQPINGTKTGLRHSKKLYAHNFWTWVGVSIVGVILLGGFGLFTWYNIMLSPAGNDPGLLKKITVKPGTNSSQISQLLEKESVIRSALVFDVYVRLSSNNASLKAGTYRLSPSESVPQIVEHFVKGSVDQFSVTFYPGATLSNSSNVKGKKYDVTYVLTKAGYSEAEINEALNAVYDDPSYVGLFAGKPSGTSLEGYVYGDTYNFNAGDRVEDILATTFKEFYSKIKQNDLEAAFKSRGLSLYQGITLASIVQRESSNADDQKQIAQVFYSRMDRGMTLGSDVTYQYIADRTGVPRDPGIDSPYNTRKYTGLPPGPIAVPGLSALQAVANPASGDYLFFLSGDDNKMYFAHTDAEHQANIRQHCQVKCATP